MRGGVSVYRFVPARDSGSSPHAWGCFHVFATPALAGSVFPTCVGVFPTSFTSLARCPGLPHMRGGVSRPGNHDQNGAPSSPHAWGCFSATCAVSAETAVFPTCVGVFLHAPTAARAIRGLPHMRGGVSGRNSFGQLVGRSSPHAWGCFCDLYLSQNGGSVFPTCVGVFPKASCALTSKTGLPHMRGGVSTQILLDLLRMASSPHAWGCFHIGPNGENGVLVFPTCVGVFLYVVTLGDELRGLSHMRGGVSGRSAAVIAYELSSPHAWGCFLYVTLLFLSLCVFPTCVGVFLDKAYKGMKATSLPHMRGGVSRPYGGHSCSTRSSPHAWGCFCQDNVAQAGRRVFPTCVGVFLTYAGAWPRRRCLPHMRGGETKD